MMNNGKSPGECDCDTRLPQNGAHYDNCRTKWEGPPDKYPRNADGTIRLLNPAVLQLETDVLYHLGLDTLNYDLPALFGDVKFVCMGGTKNRMRDFASYMSEVLQVPQKGKLVNLTKHSHRYAMYKVGPVLSVSHGIGIPSMTILLQEVIKLLYYAKCKDPVIFRIGTSGGLDIPPGSVVVSAWGMNGCLEKSYDIPILGKIHKLPSHFDQRLAEEVMALSTVDDGFRTYVGGTMAADDFYRGQARIDGPFCDYTEADKLSFLKKLCALGVKNIEMEATAFAAYTREAGIRAGDICVTLVNRLEGDQVTSGKDVMTEWQKRPMVVVGRYIQHYLQIK
ncbi:hypothetical protein O0L34_g1902 [Tuta absoluta]|nr:hypothetical protein O0L34_g1902 [Tuta absoluta]